MGGFMVMRGRYGIVLVLFEIGLNVVKIVLGLFWWFFIFICWLGFGGKINWWN